MHHPISFFQLFRPYLTVYSLTKPCAQSTKPYPQGPCIYVCVYLYIEKEREKERERERERETERERERERKRERTKKVRY